MKPERVFLGWDKPALDSIIDVLTERCQEGIELDLGSLLLVFSSARAGRRMLEKLTIFADDSGLILTPPQIITVGAFPESVYISSRSIATKLESTLAWARALSALPFEKLSIISGVVPKKDDTLMWLPIARMVQSLYSELSGECISFADAGKSISEMSTASEDDRWGVLSELHAKYLSELSSVGLIDKEAARHDALKSSAISFNGTLMLCALRDMNVLTKRFVASLNTPVISLVFAPDTLADRFDEFGSVDPKKWINQNIDIPESKIIVASDPADQALAALKALGDIKGAVHQSEIAIGQTDPNLIPYIDSVFKEAGLTLHDPGGKPICDTRPVVFLSKCAQYLSQRKMVPLLELLRFPELDLYLRGKIKEVESIEVDSLLTNLDAFQMEHIQAFAHTLPEGSRTHDKTTQAIVAAVDLLLEPFTRSNRPLDGWICEIEKLFTAIYPTADNYIDEFDALRSAWESLSVIPKELIPFLSGADAIALLLNQIKDLAIPVPRDSTAVEALGWLELQLEDVPVIIVCGMNEGSVPESVNSDSYLPESVRKHLQLLDNDRRYARDAFVLQSLVSSVPCLSLIFSRIDAQGSPLAPSRLLMSAESDAFVERVERLYLATPVERVVTKKGDLEKVGVDWEIPPKPRPLLVPVTSISVTGFKSYLQCPYRFYLSHILKLKHVDDEILEMDGAVFGSLGHSVLAAYSKSNASHTSDVEKHREALSSELDKQCKVLFGSSPLPAVLIQREQLRARLSQFALWNAEWRENGWVTKEIEYKPSSKASTIVVDGEPFYIEGRIDRIDYHSIEKTWAVFDYKFSELSKDPEQAHRNKKGWKDLQLPLYKYLLQRDGFDGNMLLGYIGLSSNAEADDIVSFAEWTQADHDEALGVAASVITKVRAQEFEPSEDGVKYSDIFDAILGVSQFYEEGGEDAASA